MSWMAAGAIAFLLARAVRAGRPLNMWLDLTLALFASLVAGLTATALDFGGWKEADPRGFTFALLTSIALLGISRTIKLLKY